MADDKSYVVLNEMENPIFQMLCLLPLQLEGGGGGFKIQEQLFQETRAKIKLQKRKIEDEKTKKNEIQ